MTPAQQVLLRRLNEGPETWQDGTPMTFREELHYEEAGWLTPTRLQSIAKAAPPPYESTEDYPGQGILKTLLDSAIYSESRNTPITGGTN